MESEGFAIAKSVEPKQRDLILTRNAIVVRWGCKSEWQNALFLEI